MALSVLGGADEDDAADCGLAEAEMCGSLLRFADESPMSTGLG